MHLRWLAQAIIFLKDNLVLPLAIAPSLQAARRFMRRQVLLDGQVADVASVMDQLGFVQMDPINVCGRMHDLILRNRVASYRENDLLAHLHQQPGERVALEQYLPGAGILVAFPISAWPLLLPGFAGDRRLSSEEEKMAADVLAEIQRRGPLSSDAFLHEGKALTAWGTPGRSVKIVLEKLFAEGRLLISGRRSFRRVYDLPERVIPARLLAAPPAAREIVTRWMLELRLRQRRLLTLRRSDLPLIEDRLQPVKIAGCPPLYCLREDAALLVAAEDAEAQGALSTEQAKPLLLAPLDPLIYDRRVALGLWNFDYIWEVYTPPVKRVRGYYALPVLAGTEIVGHVDLRADRSRRRLEVVSRKIRRSYAAAPAVRELARFLRLKT